jgi:hypothetical protein
MSRFEALRISVWLQNVATTQDEEVDCDELADAIETVLQAAERGEDVRNTLPLIAVHLEHCPDCREWVETLLVLTQEPQDAGL